MGNSSGAGLGFEVGEEVPYTNINFWNLHEGTKGDDKEAKKDRVSVFRFSKLEHADRLALAQRNVQKLRTLKHPFVLTFLDSLEAEDSVVVVTESCIPLEAWVRSRRPKSAGASSTEATTKSQKESLLNEILWGFRCVVLALEFLHTKGSLLHGNVSPSSIFVTPSGDWKLGSFELATNMSAADDEQQFLKFQHLLSKPYSSPERSSLPGQPTIDSDGILKVKLPAPPGFIDIYALGHVFLHTFNSLDLELPSLLNKYVQAMVGADMKKRPSITKVTACSIFNSEQMKLVESLDQLAFKSSTDLSAAITKLDPIIGDISTSICSHKVMPSLSKALQIALTEFNTNRDARETSRQSVTLIMNLLSKMAATGRLDEQVFNTTCVSTIIQLWSMTDRTVRTALLASLKNLAPLIPNSVVNRSVFDQLVAGFSDSNAKLRETTLMSLIYVVDKLDEAQYQDKLVRTICNLQGDPEASIRTNATIFLGKIAPKLKESVRTRVLAGSLVKALKDNFKHCRIAGLKTASASLKLIDTPQLASKLMPQACLLLLDGAADVRSAALSLLDQCLEMMKNVHKQSSRAASSSSSSSSSSSGSGMDSKNDALAYSQQQDQLQQGDNSSSSTSSSSSSSSWSSWSVLQGISKTLESAASTSSPAASAKSSTASLTGLADTGTDRSHDKYSPPLLTSASMSAATELRKPSSLSREENNDWSQTSTAGDTLSQGGGIGGKDGDPLDDLDLDDDLNLDDDDDVDGGYQQFTPGGKRGDGEDTLDDLDIDMHYDAAGGGWGNTSGATGASGAGHLDSLSGNRANNDITKASASTSVSRASIHSSSVSRGAEGGMRLKDATSAAAAKSSIASKAKPVKVAVKKLHVDASDDWDDF